MVFVKRASDLRFELFNRAGEKLLGYSRNDLLGKGNYDLWPTDQGDWFTAADRKVLASHEVTEIPEEPIKTASGETRYLHTWKVALRDASGEPAHLLGISIDITERKRVEESLRKLSLAVEQSPSSIIITDLDANIEYANAAFVKTTGYSLPEVIGQNPRLLHSGKTPRATYEDLWAHLTRGEIWKGEFINRRKDGSEFVEAVLFSPVRQPDGRVTNYLAIKEDITLFKQAQEALRNSRESLHRLLNSMAEGAYGMDINGICTFVNRAFLQILGYQDENEVLGKRMHELIHHSHADGSPYPADECRAYRAYQINQSINVSDEVFWRKDGVAIPVEYWSHPIEADGAAIGSIVTFVDITARKLAETTLVESEERFRLIVETMEEVFWVADVPIEKMYYISPGYERVWGRTIQSLYDNPRSFIEAIYPEDAERMLSGLEAEKTGQPFSHEYRIVRPDGAIRWVWDRGFPIRNKAGKVTRYAGVAQDITERKQAEAQLAEQLDELRRWHDATSSREGRILGLKHEINELLAQAGQIPRYPSAEQSNAEIKP